MFAQYGATMAHRQHWRQQLSCLLIFFTVPPREVASRLTVSEKAFLSAAEPFFFGLHHPGPECSEILRTSGPGPAGRAATWCRWDSS